MPGGLLREAALFFGPLLCRLGENFVHCPEQPRPDRVRVGRPPT